MYFWQTEPKQNSLVLRPEFVNQKTDTKKGHEQVLKGVLLTNPVSGSKRLRVWKEKVGTYSPLSPLHHLFVKIF